MLDIFYFEIYWNYFSFYVFYVYCFWKLIVEILFFFLDRGVIDIKYYSFKEEGK